MNASRGRRRPAVRETAPRSDPAGLDIAGGHDGLALAALRPGAAASTLHRVSLATGAVAAIAARDRRIGGLAIRVQ